MKPALPRLVVMNLGVILQCPLHWLPFTRCQQFSYSPAVWSPQKPALICVREAKEEQELRWSEQGPHLSSWSRRRIEVKVPNYTIYFKVRFYNLDTNWPEDTGVETCKSKKNTCRSSSSNCTYMRASALIWWEQDGSKDERPTAGRTWTPGGICGDSWSNADILHD